MEYVICYDMSDDRRRDRIAKALLDYGTRIQESVFLAHLDEELYNRMLGRLKGLLDEAEDRIHVFALCRNCEDRVLALGRGQLPSDPDFLII